MINIINTYNKKIINPLKDNITRTCNCIRKHQLTKKCLTNNFLYKASITPWNEENSKTNIYYGASETAFKLRYANSKKTCKTSNTELSNEYQNIIPANKNSNISWEFWEPTNRTTKVLNDVSYVSIKN